MKPKYLFSPGRTTTLLIVLCLCMLAACTPVPTLLPTSVSTPGATPQPIQCNPIQVNSSSGMTTILLPDNSEVYLSENTEIELTIAGYCPGMTEHRIILRRGQVAIQSHLPVGKWFMVNNPDGYVAQLNDTGAVSYDPDSSRFLLDCTNGNCALGPDAQQLTQLGCNEGGGLDLSGSFSGPFAIDINALRARYGDWITPKCLAAGTNTPVALNTTEASTPTETPTPTGTPNLAGTATAYCHSFHSQFPGTPCP
jgi:hypothetical protein